MCIVKIRKGKLVSSLTFDVTIGKTNFIINAMQELHNKLYYNVIHL